MTISQLLLSKADRDHMLDLLEEMRADNLKFQDSVANYILGNHNNFLKLSEFLVRKVENLTHIMIGASLVNLACLAFIIIAK